MSDSELTAAELEQLGMGSMVRDRDGDTWMRVTPDPSRPEDVWRLGGSGGTERVGVRSSANLRNTFAPIRLANRVAPTGGTLQVGSRVRLTVPLQHRNRVKSVGAVGTLTELGTMSRHHRVRFDHPAVGGHEGGGVWRVPFGGLELVAEAAAPTPADPVAVGSRVRLTRSVGWQSSVGNLGTVDRLPDSEFSTYHRVKLDGRTVGGAYGNGVYAVARDSFELVSEQRPLQVGDRVRVPADVPGVYFGHEVVGEVIRLHGDISSEVRAVNVEGRTVPQSVRNEYLTRVEDEPSRVIAAGSRVRLTADVGDGGVAGTLGTVRDRSGSEDARRWTVKLDGFDQPGQGGVGDGVYYVRETQMELVADAAAEPARPLQVDDRVVRVSEDHTYRGSNYGNSECQQGSRGVVTRRGSDGVLNVDWDNGNVSAIDADNLQLEATYDAEFRVGDTLEVVGDEADWSHELDPGDRVVVVGTVPSGEYDDNAGFRVRSALDSSATVWDVARRDLRRAAAEPTGDPSGVEQTAEVRAYKAWINERLRLEAVRQNWCPDYDRFCTKNGLPGRHGHLPLLVGTVARFTLNGNEFVGRLLTATGREPWELRRTDGSSPAHRYAYGDLARAEVTELFPAPAGAATYQR